VRSTPGCWPDGSPQYKYSDRFCRRFIGVTKLDKGQYRKIKPNNTEIENRNQYYAKLGYILGSHDQVAADGMGGWQGNGDEPNGDGERANDYQYPRGQSLGGVYNGDTRWEPSTGAFDKEPQPAEEFTPKKRRNTPLICSKPPPLVYF
jgi:hypothetical protein